MKKVFLLFLPMLFVACADPEMPKPEFRWHLNSYYLNYYDKGVGSIVIPSYGITGPLSSVYPNVPVSFEVEECDASWIKILNVVANEDYNNVIISYDILEGWNTGQQSRSATITITELNSGLRKDMEIIQSSADVDYYREAHYCRCTSDGNKYTLTLSDKGWTDDGSTKANSWYATVIFFSGEYSPVRENANLTDLPNGTYIQSATQNYGTGYMTYITTDSSNKETKYYSSLISHFQKDGSKILLKFSANKDNSNRYYYLDYLITY